MQYLHLGKTARVYVDGKRGFCTLVFRGKDSFYPPSLGVKEACGDAFARGARKIIIIEMPEPEQE